MAAYQSQAVEPNVKPAAGMRQLAAVADLPAADLFVARAAHSGRPEVLTNWLDPSVTDEPDRCQPIQISTRSIQPTGHRTARFSGPGTALRSEPETSALPTGRLASSRPWPEAGPGTGCSLRRAAGPICG
jgi:hypothetical protein